MYWLVFYIFSKPQCNKKNKKHLDLVEIYREPPGPLLGRNPPVHLPTPRRPTKTTQPCTSVTGLPTHHLAARSRCQPGLPAGCSIASAPSSNFPALATSFVSDLGMRGSRSQHKTFPIAKAQCRLAHSKCMALLCSSNRRRVAAQPPRLAAPAPLASVRSPRSCRLQHHHRRSTTSLCGRRSIGTPRL